MVDCHSHPWYLQRYKQWLKHTQHRENMKIMQYNLTTCACIHNGLCFHFLWWGFGLPSTHRPGMLPCILLPLVTYLPVDVSDARTSGRHVHCTWELWVGVALVEGWSRKLLSFKATGSFLTGYVDQSGNLTGYSAKKIPWSERVCEYVSTKRRWDLGLYSHPKEFSEPLLT